MVGILFTLLITFFVLSVPIAVSLGFSSLLALKLDGVSVMTLPQSLFAGLDSFPLMAVPFFILAGKLMEVGGISRRLINLANALVGWIKGGLGAVAVLATMFFSTMSGSSSATTAAIGSIMIPAMEKKGYPKNFATAVSASSGEIGVIIPPSLSFIVYGLVANVSIGSLFMAGIIPGILVGASLITLITMTARIKGFDTVNELNKTEFFKDLWKAFAESFLALLMPIIILGGIYLGIFTPTEAAVVAVAYGFFLATIVYREIKMKDVISILGKSAVMTSIIMIIVGFAAIFAYVLTANRVPHNVGELIAQVSDSAIAFLVLANIVLFFTGMFMETLASIIILAPILTPVAAQFGIDPIHFGTIMVINLAVGMVTPPVGVNLFVACQVANLRMDQLIRPLLSFLAVLVLDVLLITYIPALSLWLPSFMN